MNRNQRQVVCRISNDQKPKQMLSPRGVTAFCPQRGRIRSQLPKTKPTCDGAKIVDGCPPGDCRKSWSFARLRGTTIVANRKRFADRAEGVCRSATSSDTGKLGTPAGSSPRIVF